ncbi:MAG: hypothetical protein L0Y35_04405, partial [Flammeovirgaceae bacterium]|nr:hypothetical protein [Flammeovirgaceae bacterium]
CQVTIKKELELIMLQASPNNVLQLASLEDTLSAGEGKLNYQLAEKRMGEAKHFIKSSYY